MRTIELTKIYDTIDKVCDFINAGLNEYPSKTWHVEVNNRNADYEKDGVIWSSAYPNALTKGYLNGELYESRGTYYDNAQIVRVEDDKAAFEDTLQKIKKAKLQL